MVTLEIYNGWELYTESQNGKRIYIHIDRIVNGKHETLSGVSCNTYFYSIEKAKQHIDFVLKCNPRNK